MGRSEASKDAREAIESKIRPSGVHLEAAEAEEYDKNV